MKSQKEIEERLEALNEAEKVRISLGVKSNLVIEAFVIALEWVLQDSGEESQ